MESTPDFKGAAIATHVGQAARRRDVARPTTAANSPAASCISVSARSIARTRRCTPRRSMAAGRPALGHRRRQPARSCASPQTLAAQDLLYSVTERHGDEAHTRVVGALRDALYAPTQLRAGRSAPSPTRRATIVTQHRDREGLQPESGDRRTSTSTTPPSATTSRIPTPRGARSACSPPASAAALRVRR